MSFATDTHVERTDTRYRATITNRWDSFGPLGGYVAAIALRAAGDVARVPRPVSFSAQFLVPARHGEITLVVSPLHVGRRTELFRVEVCQNDATILIATVRTALESAGYQHEASLPESMHSPHALRSFNQIFSYRSPIEYQNSLDLRPADGAHAWLTGERSPEPWFGAWHRFDDDSASDDAFLRAARLLLIADTMPWSATVNHHGCKRIPFRPRSLDLHAWFHRPETPLTWFGAEANVPIAQAGLLTGQIAIWGEDSKLFASATSQVMCLG
jgi:acyl-CoA thioesterase